MDAAQTALKQVLLTALQTEHYGQWFYALAASQCQDARGREAFQKLAEDEQEHQRFLKGQIDALQKQGRLDRSLSLGQSRLGSDPGPIFSPAIRGRLAGAHYEMTALAVGMELELSARNFYLEQSRGAGDSFAREFFRRLADWEDGHYQALAAQQQELQQEYWQAAGFAPF